MDVFRNAQAHSALVHFPSVLRSQSYSSLISLRASIETPMPNWPTTLIDKGNCVKWRVGLSATASIAFDWNVSSKSTSCLSMIQPY